MKNVLVRVFYEATSPSGAKALGGKTYGIKRISWESVYRYCKHVNFGTEEHL